MEELKKAASKAAPPIPNGHLPKASAPMPRKMENAATVPVISDDESNDPKKRTRAEASGNPGSAASGAAWWAWRAGWHSRRNLLGSTRHALRPCLANLIVAWSPYVTPELWMRPSSSRFPLNLWSLSILSSWFNLSQLHDTLCTMRTASTQWPWLTTPTPRRMPWCHPLPRRLQRLWQSSEHLWSCQSKAWCLRCMMLQTLLKWHVLQLPLWLHPWKTWGIIASATTISAAMTSANLVGPRCCDWTSSNTHLGSLGFHCPALDSLPCRTWPTGLKKSGATLRSVWLVTWKEPMRSPRASLRAWIYALNQILPGSGRLGQFVDGVAGQFRGFFKRPETSIDRSTGVVSMDAPTAWSSARSPSWRAGRFWQQTVDFGCLFRRSARDMWNMPSAVEWLPRPQPTILRPWSVQWHRRSPMAGLIMKLNKGSLWSLTSSTSSWMSLQSSTLRRLLSPMWLRMRPDGSFVKPLLKFLPWVGLPTRQSLQLVENLSWSSNRCCASIALQDMHPLPTSNDFFEHDKPLLGRLSWQEAFSVLRASKPRSLCCILQLQLRPIPSSLTWWVRTFLNSNTLARSTRWSFGVTVPQDMRLPNIFKNMTATGNPLPRMWSTASPNGSWSTLHLHGWSRMLVSSTPQMSSSPFVSRAGLDFLPLRLKPIGFLGLKRAPLGFWRLQWQGSWKKNHLWQCPMPLP